jgi:hypothetical protein
MLRTADQGMLVAFAPPSESTNAFSFVHTDVNGVVQWYRNYPGLLGHHMVDSDRALVEKDGHYFGLGRMTFVPTNEGNALTLVELDSTGACVVERTWAGGDIFSGEGQGLVRTADNGLITVAVEHYYFSNSSWPNVSVQKWTPDLDIAWSNKYSFGYMHGGIRVLATSDGGAFLTGYVYPTMGGAQRPFFLRLSATGEVLWARRATAVQLVPQDAVEEPDGGFAICFYLASAPIVARLGADGTLLSAQRVADAPYPILPFGIARDPGTGEHLVRAAGGPDNTTYLFRLDSALAFACWSTPYTWADTLVSANPTPFPVSVSTGTLASTDTTWTGYPATFSAVDACLSLAVPAMQEDRADVWPVPTADVVHVGWKGTGAVRCDVLDAMGRTVMTEQAARVEGGSLRVDLSDLGPGAYVLRLQGADAVRSVRVVKERMP